MKYRTGIILSVLLAFQAKAQTSYPQNYFRHPLDIRMELVANFGEIRSNHWHMGLDIRTQQRVNLPVYAAADGYIARVSVEPGGFGQAIYIQHPNGYMTLYGHLNAFYPALDAYVKEQQYLRQSWEINLMIPPGMFPVQKGQFIARSGSTGASEGPHVHFEIRDSKTENNLNPLLFQFPIADAVAPSISRLAMYDRNRSTYDQSPHMIALKKNGNNYTTSPAIIRTGSDKISFAIGAVDRFTGTPNPNGIFSAAIFMDDSMYSRFELDNISYNDTRYINAQLDYPYKARGGGSLQHISPLPGARNVAYTITNEDGCLHLADEKPHEVLVEVKDAKGNTASIRFRVQFDRSLSPHYARAQEETLLPNNLNVFEKENFELYTTEKTIYDTATVVYKSEQSNASGSLSPVFTFMGSNIPVHDSVTVRIKAENDWKDRVIIKNICGSRTYVERAEWQHGWYSARFRQFGTYQAFTDTVPPTVNAPVTELSRATRIVFTPKDNFHTIRSFRAELDGQWLRFTNDKGRSWIYHFDEHFPKGEHELKVTIEDEAGNITTRRWAVRR